MSVIHNRDPEFIESVLPLARAYTNYFSPRVTGAEHIPATGPVLLAANHSGLYWMPDVFVTAMAMLDRRGLVEPSYGLTYDLLMQTPLLGDALRRIGGLPASHDAAAAGLKDGGAVLVYPGGDWEACRPWTDRAKIDFDGRDGFIRLALSLGVPVVPVVAHGSHDAVFILNRGEAVAKVLGLDRLLRIKVFPYTLGVPFGIAPVLPQVPLPAQVSVSFLPPLPWSLEPGDPDDPSLVAACFETTTGTMQAELDRLVAEVPNPLLSGVKSLVGSLLPRGVGV